MAKELTTRAVAALKPGRREVVDGRVPGLYCLVGERGPRSWVLRYRRPLDRRPAKVTLGSVYLGDDAPEPALGGPLTLAGARKVALEQRSLVDLGRDPGKERVEERVTLRAEMADTFGVVLEEYFTRAVPQRKRNRTATTTRKLIEKNCAAWLDRPIRSITRRDVRNILDGVVDRGSPAMANNLRAILSPVFTWAVEREILDGNPVALVAKPAESVERDRVLDDSELGEVWRATETLGEPWGPLGKVLILTGQRLGEVEAMRLDDLHDLDGKEPIWRIPAEVAKNGVEHHVPLSPAVVAILKEQIGARQRLVDATEDPDRRKIIASVPFVFWGGRVSRKGTITRLSGRSRFRNAWREAVDAARRDDAGTDAEPMPDWRPHDLRRTAVSGMARLGVAIHVAEIVVNHRPAQSLKGVARVYNRYDYAPEQRRALAAWADHVTALVEG